ncbi:MAG: hypothetical protein HUJ29_00860 [Gammaproteobacteria bacterium]|nr:hypothetical protein [Gammaproteobacteria bacterium]
MKQFIAVLLMTALAGVAHAQEKNRVISFDAGQALIGGEFGNSLYIFGYEAPLSMGSGGSTSYRAMLTTGTLCPYYCWDYTTLGVELRTYTGAYTDSGYFGYEALVGSHERDGLIVGFDVSLGYSKHLGDGFVVDPYVKAGSVGFAIGLNLGVQF